MLGSAASAGIPAFVNCRVEEIRFQNPPVRKTEVMNCADGGARNVVRFEVTATSEEEKATGMKPVLVQLSLDEATRILMEEIGDGATEIEREEFRERTDLKGILVIPNTVQKIGEYAFTGCINLKEARIPDSVTMLAGFILNSCSNLVRVELSNSLLTIQTSAFGGCSKLQEIQIPHSVTAIEAYAFIDCTSLLHIELPNSLRTIGTAAFQSCTMLKEVKIPNSVTDIEAYAFMDCTRLVHVTLSMSLETIGRGAFQSNLMLQEIQIPDSVVEIKEGAFFYCTGLVRVGLSSLLEEVGNSAFEECNLAKFYGRCSYTTCMVTVLTATGDSIDVLVAPPPDDTAYGTPLMAIAAAMALEQHSQFEATVYLKLGSAVVARMPGFIDCRMEDLIFQSPPVRKAVATDAKGGNSDPTRQLVRFEMTVTIREIDEGERTAK
jgi:hypothetical protein